MWVHLIVRYRDTARSFCGNCKINWEVLAQLGKEANLQMEKISFLNFSVFLSITQYFSVFLSISFSVLPNKWGSSCTGKEEEANLQMEEINFLSLGS